MDAHEYCLKSSRFINLVFFVASEIWMSTRRINLFYQKLWMTESCIDNILQIVFLFHILAYTVKIGVTIGNGCLGNQILPHKKLFVKF